MEGTGREVDLSRSRPGYRSRIRDPRKAVGSRRRLPKVRWPSWRSPAPARETDLSQGTDGQPGPRADIEHIKVNAYVRYGAAEAGVDLSGQSGSPQGIALTAIMLIGAGVLFACGALVAGFFCGLPVIPTAAVALVIAAAPLGAYFLLLLRRREP
jgi:hypothetical protein